MGLFDRFRKKTKPDDDATPAPAAPPPDDDADDDGDPSADWYRCADIASVSVGNGDELLAVHGEAAPHILPEFVTGLLKRCLSFETLDDHAGELARQLRLGQGEADAARHELAELSRLGLLVSHRDIHERARRAAATAEPPPPISSVGTITKNRIPSVRAWLESHIASRSRHGRGHDFFVLDDAPDAAARAELRGILAELRARHGVDIRYAGRDEKHRYLDLLAADNGGESLPRDALAFALFDEAGWASTQGANRNAALLHTVGDLVSTSDDDTTTRSVPAPDAEDGLTFTAGFDPTEFWFFADRDAALAAARFEDEEPLALHERLLGRSLADCVAREADGRADRLDLDDVGPRQLRLLSGGRGRVLLTMPGLVGDSGMGSTFYYLYLQGDSRDRLLSAYPRHRTTRGILRVAPRQTISEGSFLMTAVVGLDNRELLPPFLPVQRNTDGLFGLTTRLCHEEGFIGYLPRAFEHIPPEKRVTPFDHALTHIGGSHVNDMTSFCLRACSFGSGARTPEDRLRDLGRHFDELGRLSADDFLDFIRAHYWQYMASQLARMQGVLEQEGVPPAMAADVAKASETVRDALMQPEKIIPTDIIGPAGLAPAAALAPVQRLVAGYGRLLGIWPEARAAARRLRERGIRLAVPA